MSNIIRILYYSLRNWWYYQVAQPISRTTMDEFRATDDVQSGRRYLTEMLLSAVGLKTSTNDDTILPYVYLTSEQREVIDLVRLYGFKVSLR